MDRQRKGRPGHWPAESSLQVLSLQIRDQDPEIPRQPRHMVEVGVGDEDAVHAEAGAAPLELALGPLAAVEEERLALHSRVMGRDVACWRRV